jgi:serine/threonine protein kinase
VGDHENIVKLCDMVEDGNGVQALVLEYMGGGDLINFIKARPPEATDGPLQERRVFGVWRDVLLGVEHMHTCGVAHLDLKPQNVLLPEGFLDEGLGSVKLCDFSHSYGARDAERPGASGKLEVPSTQVGAGRYMGPEVSSGESYDGLRADVWSLGVILYTLLTGQVRTTTAATAAASARLHQPHHAPALALHIPSHLPSHIPPPAAHPTATARARLTSRPACPQLPFPPEPDKIRTEEWRKVDWFSPPLTALFNDLFTKDPNQRPHVRRTLSPEPRTVRIPTNARTSVSSPSPPHTLPPRTPPPSATVHRHHASPLSSLLADGDRWVRCVPLSGGRH